LPKRDQTRLIALWNLEHETPKQREEAEEKLKRKKFADRLVKQRNKDRNHGR